MVTPKPYVQLITQDEKIFRLFKNDVNESELVWHRDTTDRTVTVLQGLNWKLQMDNELPKELYVGESYCIPKQTFHRLIKGNEDLIIEIKNDTI